MQKDEIRSCGPVVSLEDIRLRRYYIALANADEDWQQTRACFALEGITLSDDDAERAGRLIASDQALEQALQEVRSAHLVW
ncbi:hypothetical protein [Undibacterium terreum]|uniref:Uncharacterized protein n=1 Tax=Undibacterium terreum TaxID=1224302 RepID=A0A916XMK6_9BURK|nr:hypothetical protein [Undibacterium terreum]GGC87127.1 hypothetical protein GCM10011396_38010 [Undibacterium terreum]